MNRLGRQFAGRIDRREEWQNSNSTARSVRTASTGVGLVCGTLESVALFLQVLATGDDREDQCGTAAIG